MLYKIYMRLNVPFKKLFIYVILTFYNQMFGQETYMIHGMITENDTTDTISQYTYPLHRDRN